MSWTPLAFDCSRPVVVLAGGASSERDVSLRSGQAVLDALKSAELDVRMVDPAETPVQEIKFRPAEVAFITLHGAYGEDGQCQRELISRGIPFTGTQSPARLERAMNKAESREVVSAQGISVAEGLTWHVGDPLPNMTLPVVVKPNRHGSSVGLTLVRHEREWLDALAAAEGVEGNGDVLIESYVPGEEWTVAVFDGHAFPPVRVDHQSELFDHTAKYSSSATSYTVLTDRDDNRFDLLRSTGARACKVLQMDGLARVDFIWNDGRPVFLELNANPGMTARSLAPLAAHAGGISFPHLCLGALAAACRVT